MNENAFDTEVRRSLVRHGFKSCTSTELLDRWSFFVGECEEGYAWTIYEFDDELSVRDYLETLLGDPVLTEFSALLDLRNQVTRLDQRFKRLLQPGVIRPSPWITWWRMGVLKSSGEEYRSDMASRYSITVDAVE